MRILVPLIFLGSLSGAADPLAPYRGWQAIETLDDPLQRAAFQANWESMKANYGETVDFQMRQHAVLLNAVTEPVLYAASQDSMIQKPISRPELEAVVAKVTAGLSDEREIALALMAFVRDLYRKPPGEVEFGGREEALIVRGDGLCECLSRLMAGLCEIAGLRSRIVIHIIGGHLANEIEIDGAWAYVDARSGLYFLKPDGSFASVADLVRDPSLLTNQPEMVRKAASPRWPYDELIEEFRNKYFHRKELIGVIRYSLADQEKYRFETLSWSQVKTRGLLPAAQEYQAAADAVFNTP